MFENLRGWVVFLEKWPKLWGWVRLVMKLEERCDDRRRLRRCRWYGTSGPRAEQLRKVRADMDAAAAMTYEQRINRAFAPLSEDALSVLEAQMVRYQDDKKLYILTNPWVNFWLRFLRVNLQANLRGKAPVLSCRMFRWVSRHMMVNIIPEALQFASKAGGVDLGVQDVIVVLPWRAALLFAEVFKNLGASTKNFWHMAVKRNHQTLKPEMYYDTKPELCSAQKVHIIADPMLATGGSTEFAIRQLRDAGVTNDKIVVLCVVAAPEGIDYLMRKYKGIRIITAALDECLNEDGYIVLGLGDYGDWSFADLVWLYIQNAWVWTGILSRDAGEIILRRTQEIAAEEEAKARAKAA